MYAALVAWIVELTLTYFFRANEFIEALPEMERAMSELALGPAFDQSVKAIQEMAREMERDGFSPLYAFVLLVNNAVVFVVFTLVGALIGRSRFEKKRNALG